MGYTHMASTMHMPILGSFITSTLSLVLTTVNVNISRLRGLFSNRALNRLKTHGYSHIKQ